METITETTTTMTEVESTPKGIIETTTVESTWDPEVHRHCTCEECVEWEEDVAHEIATLRERMNEWESGSAMHSDSNGGSLGPTSEKPSPEPKETETQVKVTEDVADKKDEPKEEPKEPSKPSKRQVGVIW